MTPNAEDELLAILREIGDQLTYINHNLYKMQEEGISVFVENK